MAFDALPGHKPWKVIFTLGETKISVRAPGQVKIDTGLESVVVPLTVLVALGQRSGQLTLAEALTRHPDIIPFMFGYSERESRVKAAKRLAQNETALQRKTLAETFIKGGVPLGQAWILARIQYPDHTTNE